MTSYTTGIFKSLKYSNGDPADITGSQNPGAITYTTDITIPAGSCVDGPFIAIHGDGDTVLVYHSNLYNIIED